MPISESSSTQTTQHSRLSTSSSLILDLKNLSAERWESFVLVYSPLLRFWISGKVINPHDAEDILQECLQSTFTGIGQFERGPMNGTFRGWLKTIAQRRVADYYRSRPEDRTAPQALLDNCPNPDQKDPGDILAEQQALMELEARALELVRQSTLEKTWKMFWQNVVEEVHAAEVARQFKVSSSAVRVAKGRVLQRLRDLIVVDFLEDS